jgi:exopolyphosphatase/guanosine-5'-triphosphate,3'-diphosphate pyrophosphatase
VQDYRAYATSAMREAYKWTKKLLNSIQDEANIKIEIIDGKKEAAIIAQQI